MVATLKSDRRRLGAALLAALVVTVAPAWPTDATGVRAAAPDDAGETRPPSAPDSVRFAVIGDAGSGSRAQYQLAERLFGSFSVFPYQFVLMLGDNIYGPERPQDFVKKFERPYQPILERKVSFYAALGNHDDPNQRFYEPFNMGGKRFYTFRKGDIRFFALDSNYMDKDQQAWLARELAASTSKWTIAFFHHPIYSSGARHGSEVDLRAIVEPLFIEHGVNVAFAGHEHFYERLKPQKGVHYFISGSAGKLRAGNIRPGPLTAKGFDADYSYLLVEVDGDDLNFQALSRQGKLVDSGTIQPSAASTALAGVGPPR
jgi:predicted phosphodiesterase